MRRPIKLVIVPTNLVTILCLSTTFVGTIPKMTLSTGNQLRAARALLGLDQAELAKRAGVDINTVRNLESKGTEPLGGRVDTLRKVQATLEGAGIEFLNHGQPGVRLSKPA